MKKLLALAFLLAPTSAFAGFGSTAHMTGVSDGTAWLAPSLDWRAKGLLFQVHLLDTLASTSQGGDFALDLGLDVTGVAVKKKCAPEVEGVIMPGASLRVANYGDFGVDVLAEARMGAEMKKGFGFGIYVVPQLGVSTLQGDFHVAYGGGLQISAWLTDK
jgi:hypothetical protein